MTLLAFVSLGLAACSQPADKPAEPTASIEFENTDYVGLSVPNAQKKAKSTNTPFRLIGIDGEAQAVTMDYRPGRINAIVEQGVIVSYTVEGAEEASGETYDANSWKTMIDDSCLSFSDGCNTCNREAGSDIAACTRKACVQYEAPKCLDVEA